MATVKYLDDTGLSTVWSKVKGIVTPKADKVSGATNGHLAGLNSSGNLTDSGLAATNIAQKDGSYSGMTVGAAEDLVSAESVASEFTSRITGGSTAVGKGGTALLDRIKGRTLVWNQLVQNGDFSNGLGGWTLGLGVTASVSGNVCTITASDTSASIRTSLYAIAGHKYYFSMVINSAVRGNVGYFSSPTQWIGQLGSDDINKDFRFSNIVTANNSTIYLFVGAYSTQAGNSFTISNVQCIDLTLMFGAGNEPSTIADFEALYPGPYYDYNPGTLISNAATAIETVGWNAFDNSTLQLGKYRNVSNTEITIAGRRCSDEYFHCIGGANYNLSTDSTFDSTFLIVVCWYDSAKQFISGYNCNHAVIAFPSNAAYFRISSAESAGNICISLADPSRNGTYEPHWRSELELGLGDIKVKSHNIWDEEWETGTISQSTGANQADSTRIRSKNYISVNPGDKLYFYGASGYVYYWIFYYDSNRQFIVGSNDGSTGYKNNININNIGTVPANARYLRFYCASQINTYQNDICINLSDPAYNGRYEPYGDGGVISITGGLKSSGAVYDEISGGKLVKRIGSADMGTLDWTYGSSSLRFVSTGLVGKIKTPDVNDAGNAISTRFQSVSYSYLGTDRSVCVIFTGSNAAGQLWLYDSAYTDATTFTAAMSGVPLYYELAQPIEYELAEAIPTAMRNDPYGTERRLPEDTAAVVTAPFRADITYSTNIKEAVQSLPQNYINVNSMQDFLAALGEQMGGTWTMRPADGKFDFTFTPNPVEPTL